MEAARRPEHRRHTGAVDRQKADTEIPHDEEAPERANRCLCNVLRHTLCSSTNGTFRHCRFGKTRNACPAISVGRTARPNSRNRRFALFRRTAVPNRRPMTIPIMASWGIAPGLIWRLNNPVETRRPFFLMSWISRLRFKKNDADACPAVITDLSAGYQVRPGSNHVKPHIVLCIAHVLPRPGSDDSIHPGDHPPPGCLPTCRLPSGRKESDGEASAALGSATSDDLAAVLCAHALPKSMLSFALEI